MQALELLPFSERKVNLTVSPVQHNISSDFSLLSQLLTPWTIQHSSYNAISAHALNALVQQGHSFLVSTLPYQYCEFPSYFCILEMISKTLTVTHVSHCLLH